MKCFILKGRTGSGMCCVLALPDARVWFHSRSVLSAVVCLSQRTLVCLDIAAAPFVSLEHIFLMVLNSTSMNKNG